METSDRNSFLDIGIYAYIVMIAITLSFFLLFTWSKILLKYHTLLFGVMVGVIICERAYSNKMKICEGALRKIKK